jgi:hypothetical protein
MRPSSGRQGHYAVGSDRDSRERRHSLEWDVSHGLDDCRSVSSQKSDAGYQSSGATSDMQAKYDAAVTFLDQGCYNSMSSARSVGSTGSQGSLRGVAALPSPHLLNGETRFPTAASYASDAQRSDAATVCSGSVMEDIEVESVVSADLNAQPTVNPTSPPSAVKMKSVNQLDSVLPQKLRHRQQLADHILAEQQNNTMGPPLSRSLLLQHPHHHHNQDTLSRAGSTGSDVVAQVDTDDCGGSLDLEDSVHSQEESQEEDPQNEKALAAAAVNPLHCASSDPNSMGRISPGGTVYRGRGNRRYQGRFMKLPLKRFHHNGVHLGTCRPDSNEDDGRRTPYGSQASLQQNGGWEKRDRKPRGRRVACEGRRLSRPGSRSRSRSRDRDQNRSSLETHRSSPQYNGGTTGQNAAAHRRQDTRDNASAGDPTRNHRNGRRWPEESDRKGQNSWRKNSRHSFA